MPVRTPRVEKHQTGEDRQHGKRLQQAVSHAARTRCDDDRRPVVLRVRPPQLLEIALLRPAVDGRPAPPSGADPRDEELRLDGGRGQERQDRRQPRLQARARKVGNRKSDEGETPEPERAER